MRDDDYVIECWIAGCAWSTVVPRVRVRDWSSADFDEHRVAHMWLQHTVAEVAHEADRRVVELHEHPEYIPEQVQDRNSILRILASTITEHPDN